MRQVCELLDCSDDTIRRLVRRGLLAAPQPYQGLGKRWTAEDLEDYQALQRARNRLPPEARQGQN